MDRQHGTKSSWWHRGPYRVILAMAICGGLIPQAQAAQVETFALTASQVINMVVFRFGTNPWVDDFTPPQTGLASSALLETNGGVNALLAANPTASARLSYEPALVSATLSNGVLSAYMGGASLSITLPAGHGGGPLVFDNAGGSFPGFGVVNNGRVDLSGRVSVLLPGSTDALLFSMSTDDFTNSDLTRANTPGLTSKVDLLADPQFLATYNSPVPLPASLIVTMEHPTSLRLNDPSLQLVDPTGTALGGLNPPGSISLEAFDRQGVLLPFDGVMNLSLQATDYANPAAYSAAQLWIVASGLDTQVMSRQVAVWQVSSIPEPGAGLMFSLGLAVLAWRGRKFLHRP